MFTVQETLLDQLEESLPVQPVVHPKVRLLMVGQNTNTDCLPVYSYMYTYGTAFGQLPGVFTFTGVLG